MTPIFEIVATKTCFLLQIWSYFYRKDAKFGTILIILANVCLLSPDPPLFFSSLSLNAPGFGSLSLTPISISYWSPPPPRNIFPHLSAKEGPYVPNLIFRVFCYFRLHFSIFIFVIANFNNTCSSFTVSIDSRNPWTPTATLLTCITIVCLMVIALNIRIRGRKCWTYIPACNRNPHMNYPDVADDIPPRPQCDSLGDSYIFGDTVLDRDSIMDPPPPSYYHVANDDQCESPYGHLALFSLGGRNNSVVFQDDESLPSSPPPAYDSVSEYSRYVLSTTHYSGPPSSFSVGNTPVGTPLTMRSFRTCATPVSGCPSPRLHGSASRIWWSSNSPCLSPQLTPDVPNSPPPPYSETNLEGLTRTTNASSTEMPSVDS